jgi:hypothetical protein
MKVQEATYKGGYDIHVLFEDGIAGTIHLNGLVENGIFRPLKDTAQFAKVYTTGYSIAWSDQLEIDAATIYAELSGKPPGEVFLPPLSYATN